MKSQFVFEQPRRAQVKVSQERQFNIGDIVTCQLGNPSDTDWTEATHASVKVQILDKQLCPIIGRYFYLIKHTGRELVGRATLMREPRHRFNDVVHDDLYCTSARTYGKEARTFTGIETLEQARHSLNF